jgi:hypothetical protein
MRNGCWRLSLLAAVVATGALGLSAASASAMSCTPGTATPKFSPGLSETPAVQNIKVKGAYGGCSGGLGAGAGITSGTYTASITTLAAQTCKSLETAPGVVATGSEIIKWKPGKLQSHVSLEIASSGALGVVTFGFAEEKGILAGAQLLSAFEPKFSGKGAPCTAKGKLKSVNVTFSLLQFV